MKSIILLIAIFLGSVNFISLLSQEHLAEEDSEHQKIRHHWINLFTGYTLINEAVSEDGTEINIVPTLGIDYEYKLNHRMSLAWVNEFELSTYAVETDQSEELERSFAIVSALVFSYDIFPFWGVFAGPGYEFEENESFYTTKLGTEFMKEFDSGWVIALSLSIDIKEVNTSPSFGVVVKRALSKPK